MIRSLPKKIRNEKIVSKMRPESSTEEGDSPVCENDLVVLGTLPKYHGARGILWESTRTVG